MTHRATAAWLIGWVSAAACACGTVPSPEPSPAEPETVPAYLNLDPEVRYVGRAECRDCHLDVWSTFRRTGMGRSFYRLSERSAVEDFSGRAELVHPASGVRYRMLERDGRFFQRQYLRDAAGQEVAVDERELTWVVGSNNHGRGYVTLSDDGFFQTPGCWDAAEERWILCPGFEQQNSHFSREIGYTCLFCHNGRMTLVEGKRNVYHEPIPRGIGCERCHGPGELHVDYHGGRGGIVKEQSRLSIVHPGRLPLPERIQVCFQCHLGDSSATVRVVRHGRTLADFRPGMPLTDVMMPFRYVEPTAYDFGIAAQADRMILSRCYLESDGALECLTCHDPHVTVYRDDRPPNFFTDRCIECHGRQGCTASPAPVDGCVGCHMRRGEPVDRRYAQFTDHWIRRTLPTERDPRTSWELEPIFRDAFAAVPPGERAYLRARANLLASLEAPARARALLWSRAEAEFQAALDAEFDSVETRFYLGKVYEYMRRPAEALEAFAEAVGHDPLHHDARFSLGQASAALGRLDDARAHFESLLAEDPWDAAAAAELGRVAFAQGRVDDAVASFERATRLEPWNAMLQLNLGGALAAAGRFGEAADAAAEACRLDPDSTAAWDMRANAARAAGRRTEAATAARQRELLR